MALPILLTKIILNASDLNLDLNQDFNKKRLSINKSALRRFVFL